MLSIGGVSSAGGASTYFAKDNYYTKSQGLGDSEWFGIGAADMGLMSSTALTTTLVQEDPDISLASNVTLRDLDTHNAEHLMGDKSNDLQDRTKSSDTTNKGFSNPGNVSKEPDDSPDQEKEVDNKEPNENSPDNTVSRIDAEDFKKVLEGHVADNKRVGRMGKDGEWKHIPGIDLTFAPPKSVSVMGLVGGDRRLVDAWNKSVKETLSYAEEHYAVVQDKAKQGPNSTFKTGNLTVALFTHDTNRNQDPFLHIHAIVANVTKDPRTGEYRTLYKRPLYKNRYTLSRMADALMQKKVQELGYRTVPVGEHGAFEIATVPSAVIRNFSSRRNEIEEHGANSEMSWNKRQVATLETRAKKVDLPRNQLNAQWKERSEGLGFDAKTHIPEGPDLTNKRWNNPKAITESIATLTRNTTVLTREDLINRTLAHPLNSASPNELHDIIDGKIQTGALLEHKDKDRGKTLYTTPEHVANELKLIEKLKEAGANKPLLKKAAWKIRSRLAKDIPDGKGGSFTLNETQIEVGLHILTSTDRDIGIQGLPGVGKTTAMGITINTLREGFRFRIGSAPKVIGMAPTINASKELAEKTNGTAITVQKFIASNQNVLRGEKPGREQLQKYKGSIVLHDESSMLSTKMGRDFDTITDALGVIKRVRIGDTDQNESIEAGAAFRVEQTKGGLKTAVMPQMMRQKNDELKKIASEVTSKQWDAAFKTLEDTGRLQSGDDYGEMAAQKYLDIRERGEEVALITPDNISRVRLNNEVRSKLKEKGLIGKQDVKIDVMNPSYVDPIMAQYAQSYNQGDKLIFNKDIYGSSITNGSVWTVRNTNLDNNSLLLSDGTKTQKWELRDLKELPFEHMKPAELKIALNDEIEFKKEDKEREIARKAKGTVKDLSKDTITVKLDNGTTIKLDKNDPIAQSIDHSYTTTAYNSQGSTYSNVVIGIRAFTKALHQRAVDVMFTRPVNELYVFADNADKALENIKSNDGGDKIAMNSKWQDSQKDHDSLTTVNDISKDVAREQQVQQIERLPTAPQIER